MNKLMIFLFITSHAFAAQIKLNFQTRCSISYSNVANRAPSVASNLLFIVDNKYIEAITCGFGRCISERTYLAEENRVSGLVHEYIAKITQSHYDLNSYSVTFEGTDSNQKRKITLDLKTGRLALMTFGKTLIDHKTFEELDVSSCGSTEVTKL